MAVVKMDIDQVDMNHYFISELEIENDQDPDVIKVEDMDRFITR